MSGAHSHIVVSFGHIEVNADTLIQIWGIMGVVLVAAYCISKRLRTTQINESQYIAELVYGFWFNQLLEQLGAEKAKKYLPFIGGIFLFFLVSYWSSLIPWSAIQFAVPFWPQVEGGAWHYVSPILDMNVPMGIAFLSLVIYLWAGIRYGGIGYLLAYLGITYHKGKLSIGVPSVILGLIEWLDLVTRPITLSLRIYANVLAGEALALVVTSIMPAVAPVSIMFFESGVGVLQSFIFAMLSLVYIKIAISHSEEH